MCCIHQLKGTLTEFLLTFVEMNMTFLVYIIIPICMKNSTCQLLPQSVGHGIYVKYIV